MDIYIYIYGPRSGKTGLNDKISLLDIFNYRYLLSSKCQKNYDANTFNYF